MRALALALGIWVLPAGAVAGGSVDAKFDKTGDGLVDASDWRRMSAEERMAYARASLRALGEDPDAVIEAGETRAARYLRGLEAVYAR